MKSNIPAFRTFLGNVSMVAAWLTGGSNEENYKKYLSHKVEKIEIAICVSYEYESHFTS